MTSTPWRKAVRTAAILGASVINISSIALRFSAAAPDDRRAKCHFGLCGRCQNAVIVAAARRLWRRAVSARRPQVTQDASQLRVGPAGTDDVLTVGSVNAQGEPSFHSRRPCWWMSPPPAGGDDLVNRSVTGP